MRNFIVVAAALAAISCGGTSANLSQDEAQSVASEISAAMQTHAESASGSKLLTFGGSSSATAKCVGGGTMTVNASVSVNCPSGYRSCTSTGSLSLAADDCTTGAGVIIDGTVTGKTTGTGISFTTSVSGSLIITRPGEGSSTCVVALTASYGHISGSVCGITVSK